jgi:putative DNA primase/helicase
MSKVNDELDAKVIALDGRRAQEEPRPPAFSDEALALRFADLHADDLRYVAAWNRWLSWDGGGWKPDETRLAFSLARQVCRKAASECDPKKKLAAQLASAKTRAAVITLANDDRRLAVTADHWDRDLDLLNTKED